MPNSIWCLSATAISWRGPCNSARCCSRTGRTATRHWNLLPCSREPLRHVVGFPFSERLGRAPPRDGRERRGAMMARGQLRFWLIGLGLLVVALYLLRGILLPFVAGMAIAYFLDPLCDWLENHGCSRNLATVLVSIGFVFVLVIAFLFLVPLLERQI